MNKILSLLAKKDTEIEVEADTQKTDFSSLAHLNSPGQVTQPIER